MKNVLKTTMTWSCGQLELDMNERIKELARKANMVEVEYSPGFPDIRYPKNFEKFAELIVKECAKVADEGYASDNFGNGICGAQLLEHFGVEE